MRILLLTQYFPPETGAPQNRLGDLTARLSEAGHEVAVLTALPNYPRGRIYLEWRGRLTARHRACEADVSRVWIYAAPGTSVSRQLVTYFTFAIGSLCVGLRQYRRFDVVLWESPPLFLAPTARILASWVRARLVMNVSDLWPESARALGVVDARWAIRAAEVLERWAYRTADLVTCQTDGIVAGVKSRAPSAPTYLLPNGVDTEFYRRIAIESDAGKSGFTLGYAGNLGRSQALEQLLEAIELLGDIRGLRVEIVGDGPRRRALIETAETMGLSNVVFRPPVERDVVPRLLASWDAAIVPLARGRVFEGARPSKMYELLACEVPFIYCGAGEGAEVARASGGSLVVPPEAPQELAATIRSLLSMSPEERRRMGRSGRAYVTAYFDRRMIAASVEQRLQELLQEEGRRH
jgi:colanic acid biosynthesis glycosyl transferase WcaI